MTLSCSDLYAWTVDFFLPSRCAACGIGRGTLCNRCTAEIATAPAIVRSARDGAPGATALGMYDGRLRCAILALKFRGARSIGSYLGRWLSPKILWNFDAVVPVPLHAARLRERGYNQANEIARAIASQASVPNYEHALTRVRETRPQSTLDLGMRVKNVAGAFAPGPSANLLEARRVLLVDDVITTGATARACAVALVAAGAAAIYLAAGAVRL